MYGGIRRFRASQPSAMWNGWMQSTPYSHFIPPGPLAALRASCTVQVLPLIREMEGLRQ